MLDDGTINYYSIPFEIFMREAVIHIDYSNYFRDLQYIFPRIQRLDIDNPIYWEELEKEKITENAAQKKKEKEIVWRIIKFY